jgi:hypothetical protein
MPRFTLPEGVEIPENLKEGEAFQTMATIVLGKGGKAEVIEIDGVAIAGYEGKKPKYREGEEEEEDDEMEAEGGEGGGFVAEVMRRGAGGPMRG